MKLRISKLRRIIRTVLLENYEHDEDYYDRTVLPDDEADNSLLAEPDLTDQKERDEYVGNREKKRKRKVRLKSAEETSENMGDEHVIATFAAPLGTTGSGPGTKPYGKQRKLKSKNAFGQGRPLDEYDE